LMRVEFVVMLVLTRTALGFRSINCFIGEYM
jgi:hypothetical protein